MSLLFGSYGISKLTSASPVQFPPFLRTFALPPTATLPCRALPSPRARNRLLHQVIALYPSLEAPMSDHILQSLTPSSEDQDGSVVCSS